VAEGAKKKRAVQQALEGAMLPREHPDEGKVHTDYVPTKEDLGEVTPKMAAEDVARAKDKALETSIYNQQFGRRTFPPALDFRYATPTYTRNDERQAATARETRSYGQPFFTDPGSGEVDFNQEILPYVFGNPLRDDRSSFPATINKQGFTQTDKDPFRLDTSDAEFTKRARAQSDAADLRKMRANPLKTMLSEMWRVLGVPGRHSPNYKK
jgi:hypothetical protein